MPNAHPQIVVAGSANFDYLARGPKLPGPGETVLADLIDEAPGGKGANQAVAAARLGAQVAFLGRVGCDERANAILQALEREKVATSQIVHDPHAPTGVALIQIDAAGEKQITAVKGANSRLSPEDIQAASELIVRAKALLLQLEIPLPTILAAAKIARAAGVQVILDPAPAIPLPDELFPLLDAMKPNSSEARVLTGIDVRDQVSARSAARQLLERGVGGVAIGLSEGGTMVAWKEGERWIPWHDVTCIDATGAGDAFAAALAVSLAQGTPFSEACLFANAAAALSTTKIGAQAGMPTLPEIERFLRERVR